MSTFPRKSNYSFSASWFNQNGTIIGSDYSRLTARANTSFQVKPWLKVTGNIGAKLNNVWDDDEEDDWK